MLANPDILVCNTEELRKCLREVKNGDVIVLAEGVYQGGFVLDKDNVQIVGAGAGRTILRGLKNNDCLTLMGNGCTISDLEVKIILEDGHDSRGIDISGSRNTIRNVDASGDGICFNVSGEGNKLEHLTITDAFNGICISEHGLTIVDDVEMRNVREYGIRIFINSTKQNIISNVTCINAGMSGIWVCASNNEFHNIVLEKKNSSNGLVGMHFSTGSNNTVSNLTCSGYSKNCKDFGLLVNSSSDMAVKYSQCGRIWMDGKDATLTNVDCGEELEIGDGSVRIKLSNCWGHVLKVYAPRNEVKMIDCNFHKIMNKTVFTN